MNLAKYLDIAPEVKSALENGKPVVALESTIISHGMPYPQNVNTARNVEKIIRSEGAVPATIAIIGGKFKVGLSDEEIEYFGKKGQKITKASRRDLPILAAAGMDGATTVASTMIIAAMAGVKIFATGGIGGVHRGAETTMDISADLEELGRTDVMVVCAGAKSILDIGLTLEYLETKGVPVIGFGTDELPAFYCRESGFGVDYRINTPNELAAAFKAKLDLGIHGGMLVGNPIPKEYAMSKGMADRAIEIAVKKAEENNIKGKELTPFLLTLVKEMTGGMSLDANIELVYNNARVAAKTAVQLAVLCAEDEQEESLDELRAEIADDTAESIKTELAAFRGEMETLIAQRVAAMQQMAPNPYMNPYMNPYAMPQQQMQYQQNPQQMPQYQQNPYGMPQQMPQFQQNPYGMPQQPMAQPAPAPAPAPYVNPYKPVRPEPVPEVQPEPVPAPNPYKSVPDEEWVNPFAPKRAKAEEPVVEEPAEEVIEEAIEEPVYEEPAEEIFEEPEEEIVTEEEPAEEEPAEEVPAEEPAPAEEEEEEEYTVTEYVPPVREEKRKPDNQVKPETDSEGMTAYDPEFYRKRAEERKQRLAEAAGEQKHKEEAKAAEPEYIDCKGPLEFTGEHPWAWKCTRCGQLFQKHEIPHKCVKTD
ncbi:MAG: pseudouridine-5'-phosphate glycosidase [Oscillospiraceae bacterium]|nr:pseudouridine-5'-phosphate glycosidase [Oscillospiraceae bacterium]MBQ2998542.1 pseudouridine-5'-phosphate glycosidase [Oscillospiraceae bacterium]